MSPPFNRYCTNWGWRLTGAVGKVWVRSDVTRYGNWHKVSVAWDTA